MLKLLISLPTGCQSGNNPEKMMRALALLLVLANICVYFWAHYVDVPEATLVTSPVVINSDKAPSLMLARERSEPAVAENRSSEAGCISVGPFADAGKAGVFAQRLQAANFTSVERTEASDEFAGYWVSLQGFSSKAEAEKALKQLHAGGLSDAYILTEEQPPNVLSLGLFSEQQRAEARLEAIKKLGFQPLLQNRTRKVEKHWLDVSLSQPGQQIDSALLQSDGTDIVRLQTKACPAATQEAMPQTSAASAP